MTAEHNAQARIRPASRFAILAAFFVAQVVFVVLASDAYMLRIDDSFYYYGIARHAAADGRFTFDGIHLSNGFQPLWQLTLVAITWIAQRLGATEPYSLARLYLVVGAAFNTIAAWLAMGLLDQHLGKGSRATRVGLILFVWFPGLTVSLLCGMESCMNWPLLLALFRLLADEEGRFDLAAMPARRFASLVGVSALLVYARLDNAVILAVTVVYLWARARDAATIKRGVLWGAGTLVLWAPILLWGQHVFASPTPVSGTVKMWNTSHFVEQFGAAKYALTVVEAFVLSVVAIPASALGMGYYEILKPIVMRVGFSVAIAVVGVLAIGLGVLVLGLRRKLRLKPRAKMPAIVPLLAIVSIVHLLLLSVLFPDQWMYAGLVWYDLVEYLCLFLVVGWLGGWIASGLSDVAWRRVGVGVPIAMVLTLVPMITWRPEHPTEAQIRFEAAKWINENLPPTAVVGSDDAGVLGYFARVPVINLDGLVNTRDYLNNYLKPGKKKQYLYDAGITHLADIDCPKKPTARFRSLLYLPREAEIVYQVHSVQRDIDYCIVAIKR